MKLNVALALREKLETVYKGSIADMVTKFTKNQGIFKGFRKTYQPKEGFADDPTKRGFRLVQSTVKEQLDWMSSSAKDYLNTALSIERTNGSGLAKAELIVEGQSWGELSSAELLRLKGILESGNLKSVFENIPVKESTVIWKPSDDEAYQGREVFEDAVDAGSTKTTLKEAYIVNDPHIAAGNRPPIVSDKTTQVNTGDYTSQNFSGEYSLQQRAEILKRASVLHTAVIKALEEANTVEVSESTTGTKVFDYLFAGN